VKAISQACEFIKKNPAATKEIVKNEFPEQELSINKLWDKVDFSLKFDYDKMKELIFRDSETIFESRQSRKDNADECMELRKEEIDYYFNHNFKFN
jgi:ABC-type nitrate/sulfonate/bicarbonate transport system substrate-binding protein